MPIGQAGTEIYAPGGDMHELLMGLAITRAGDPLLPTDESPVLTGDFSFNNITVLDREPHEAPEACPAVTVVDDYLPPIFRQVERFEEMQDIEMLGDLMCQARLSKLTGCFLRPDLWRNHNGYAKVKSQAAKELGLGSWRDIHRFSHFMYKIAITGEMPTPEEKSQKVDHICRNPSCFNPAHTRLMPDRENNILKDKAKKLEPAIVNGQLVYLGDLLSKMPWLEHTVMSEDGELPDHVISTRLGPFALRLANPEEFVVYGQRLTCDAYDALRPFGKTNYVAPSRAKKFQPAEGNRDLFPKTKFRKKKPPMSQKDLYEQAMAA